MTMGIIYSGIINSTNGEITFPGHTYAVYLINKDHNDWVQVKMNGGPHSIWLADANGHAHAYTEVPGDYTKIQVMTASANVAVYAIG